MAEIYPKNGDSEHAADYGYGTARPVQADIPAYPSNRGRRNGKQHQPKQSNPFSSRRHAENNRSKQAASQAESTGENFKSGFT